jgi:3',5'-cyclic-AMP phosphodiesterase
MRSLRLLQFTDMHLCGDPDGELRGIATLPAFEVTLEHAARRYPARDAILLTGDLVQDDPGGYAHVARLLGGAAVPVVCLAGNHDLPGPMAHALARDPFQMGGTLLRDRWLVVMLDSWVDNAVGGRLGAGQLGRLDALLGEHHDRYALICLHHHPVAMQSDWLDGIGLADGAALLAVLARHANVRGVLWGHVHQALDTYVGGVHFMATPSTCSQFRPRSERFALDDRPPGYRVLELGADGHIATEVVWAEAVCA